MDFLDCLASAVHFEVILLLNTFEIKKVSAIISIWYRIGVRKNFQHFAGKMDQSDTYTLKNKTNIPFNSITYRQV